MWSTRLSRLRHRRTPDQLEKRRERIKSRKMKAIITRNVRVKKGSALT